jgi:hypothetical protein
MIRRPLPAVAGSDHCPLLQGCVLLATLAANSLVIVARLPACPLVRFQDLQQEECFTCLITYECFTCLVTNSRRLLGLQNQSPSEPFSLPSNTLHRLTTPASQPSMILDRNGSILPHSLSSTANSRARTTPTTKACLQVPESTISTFELRSRIAF